MADFAVNNVRLDGLACCVPPTVYDNKDYPFHTEKENEQFLQTTGIRYRRLVNKSTTAADLCEKAADDLIDKLNIDRNEIKVLIFLSQTPDYLIPATAAILQHKLNLSTGCLSFDVNLGCSGYVYALSIAGSLLNQVKGKALILVGDTSSTCINQEDKTTAPLFSDAGSASILSYDEGAEPMHFNLSTDGKGYNAIITESGGSRNPISKESLIQNEETKRRPIDMHLDGIKVFNFSRKEVAQNVKDLYERTGKEINSTDHFIFHQANLFMNESIRKKLGLPEERVPYSLKDFGNTSSASIPVTMVDKLSERLAGENTLCLSGFGVGLSWGSVLLTTKDPVILPMITFPEQ